jgi:WD40 repeat protein
MPPIPTLIQLPIKSFSNSSPNNNNNNTNNNNNDSDLIVVGSTGTSSGILDNITCICFCKSSTRLTIESNNNSPTTTEPYSLGDPPPLFIGRSSGKLTWEQYSHHQQQNDDDESLILIKSTTIIERNTSRGINDISISGDGKRMVYVVEDGKIGICNVETLQIITVKDVGEIFCPTCVSYSPQGNMIVIGTYEGSLHVWDSRDMMSNRVEVRRISPAHGAPIVSTEFHPDGSVLISASMDGLARCWDITTGNCLATLMGSVNGERGLSGASFSRNGKYCLLGTLDAIHGSLGLWDVSNSSKLNLIRTYSRENGHYWLRAGFIDSFIVGGEENGSLTIWDPVTTKVISSVSLPSIRAPLALSTCDVVRDVTPHHDNSILLCGWIAVGGIGSPECTIWKLQQQQQ